MALNPLRGLCLLALLLPLPLVAQEGGGEAARGLLFVSSEPLGAVVYLDGARQARPTPLLLRDLGAGKHRLRLEKEGYIARELLVSTPEAKAVGCGLVPAQAMAHFEGVGTLLVAGRPVGPADGSLCLEPGSFTLRPGEGGLEVTPVFGQQRLLDGIRLALPLFLCLSGVLTVREIVWPRESGLVIAPELAASSLIGGGLIGWDIALEAKKREFLEDYKVSAQGPESLALAVKARFDEASRLMIEGDFESALSRFEALAAEHPDSPFAARALFESARLRYLTGDREGAAAAFGEVIEDYPEPELYDRSVKGLADCRLAKGDLAGALAELELLTYLGPGPTREEIGQYRQAILGLQAAPLTDSSPGSP
jgi:hypothetical protein